jgi:hypothetical protein
VGVEDRGTRPRCVSSLIVTYKVRHAKNEGTMSMQRRRKTTAAQRLLLADHLVSDSFLLV